MGVSCRHAGSGTERDDRCRGSSFRNQRENGKAERGDGPGSARDDRPRGVSALRTLDDRAKPGAHLAGKNFRESQAAISRQWESSLGPQDSISWTPVSSPHPQNCSFLFRKAVTFVTDDSQDKRGWATEGPLSDLRSARTPPGTGQITHPALRIAPGLASMASRMGVSGGSPRGQEAGLRRLGARNRRPLPGSRSTPAEPAASQEPSSPTGRGGARAGRAAGTSVGIPSCRRIRAVTTPASTSARSRSRPPQRRARLRRVLVVRRLHPRTAAEGGARQVHRRSRAAAGAVGAQAAPRGAGNRRQVFHARGVCRPRQERDGAVDEGGESARARPGVAGLQRWRGTPSCGQTGTSAAGDRRARVTQNGFLRR